MCQRLVGRSGWTPGEKKRLSKTWMRKEAFDRRSAASLFNFICVSLQSRMQVGWYVSSKSVLMRKCEIKCAMWEWDADLYKEPAREHGEFCRCFSVFSRDWGIMLCGHRSKPRFESGGLCVISEDNTTDLPAFHSPTIRAEALEYERAAEGFLGHNQRNHSHIKITQSSVYSRGRV